MDSLSSLQRGCCLSLYERLLEEKIGLYGVSEAKEEARGVSAGLGGAEFRGLYGKLLVEKTEEEGRRGKPLGTFYGLDSIALEVAMKRRPGCGGDLYKLYRFINEGVGGSAAGMRFGNLKKKYPEEYAMLKAECEGELYEQQELLKEKQ